MTSCLKFKEEFWMTAYLLRIHYSPPLHRLKIFPHFEWPNCWFTSIENHVLTQFYTWLLSACRNIYWTLSL